MKPVLFVPGFPATELRRRSDGELLFPPPALSIFRLLLSPRRVRELLAEIAEERPGERVVAGEPIGEVFFLGRQAESLYDNLRALGYVTRDNDLFQAVGWDWRLALDEPPVLAAVRQALDRLTAGGRRAVAIVHSTGGLILRRLLEEEPARAAQIERIVAFGVPWAGNVKALHYLHRGEGNVLLSSRDARHLMRRAQAAYDLLPPDPSTSPPTTPPLVTLAGSGRRIVTSPLVERSWMPGGEEGAEMARRADRAGRPELAHRQPRIDLGGAAPPPIVNVVGWGVTTPSWAELSPAGDVAIHVDTAGDGTASEASAAWLAGPGVETFFLPLGIDAESRIPLRHARIWDGRPVVELLERALRDAPPRPFVAAAVEGRDERRAAVRTVRLSAQAADASPLPAARAIFRAPLAHVGPIDFAGRTHLEHGVPTAGLSANAPDRALRFVVEIAWGGGGAEERREVALAMLL